MPAEQNASQRPRKRGFVWVFLIVAAVVVILLVVFVGWLPRHKRQEEIDRRAKAEANAIPEVEVQAVRPAPASTSLTVPGSTSAYTEAYIYARANGYLSKRLVDIGDRVRQGQLLAIIEAPDLDQQVSQARQTVLQSENQLNQLQAQLQLASVTWDRYKVLVAKGVFSRQDGDTQRTNFEAAGANVRAAENTIAANKANLDRMLALQQYERVTAPFDGVVTARNVDVGALISAQGTGLGSSTTDSGGTLQASQANNGGTVGSPASTASATTGGAQGGPMFIVSKFDRLRILISAPEAYASSIKVGERAALHFDELPKGMFEGRVTRTAASIDTNTRTLLVEVQVGNSSGRLMPGMYVVVDFIGMRSTPSLIVPGDAIAVRNGKTVVAKINNNTVHYQPIEVGRDYGEETEVTGGLNAGDVIATSISDEVHDGAKIKAKSQPPPKLPGSDNQNASGGVSQYGDQALADQSGQPKGGAKGGGKQGSSKQSGPDKKQ